MAGGAAFYAGRAAAGLGLRAAVVTSLGLDFGHAAELAEVELCNKPAVATTRFENRYGPAGRSQRLDSLAAPLVAADVPARLRRCEAVYVCPVMGEVDLGIVSVFRSRVRAGGAQGWMRQADGAGRISSRRWRPLPGELARFDLLVLSDEDVAGDVELVDYLAEHLPLLAYTHGADGCELFVRAERHVVPAYPTEQVGPTGAGDVFGAAMVTALLDGMPPLRAAAFAACAASIVVEAPGGEALDRMAETPQRLQAYERRCGVDLGAQRDADEPLG